MGRRALGVHATHPQTRDLQRPEPGQRSCMRIREGPGPQTRLPASPPAIGPQFPRRHPNLSRDPNRGACHQRPPIAITLRGCWGSASRGALDLRGTPREVGAGASGGVGGPQPCSVQPVGGSANRWAGWRTGCQRLCACALEGPRAPEGRTVKHRHAAPAQFSHIFPGVGVGVPSQTPFPSLEGWSR